MPSEMFERGRRDAEADALDENYYQYYYDYKLGYDQVLRHRRRTRRQLMFARIGRFLLWAVPVLALVGAGFAGYRYVGPGKNAAASPIATPTRTPRPTLVQPTPQPSATPTSPLALRANSFALIAGTDGAPLLVRKAPGKDKPVVTKFSEGQTVKILEGPQDANGLQWWRIELKGQNGWSAAPYLKPVPPPATVTPG